MKRKIGVEWLAKQANVSIGTVDRALHARPGINDKTRDRIIGIARALEYRPNLAASVLARRRAHVRIGVCIPQKGHSFYDRVWDGIYDQARQYRDYRVDFIFRPLHRSAKPETEFQTILDSGVDGLILTPPDPMSTTSIIDAAEEKGTRILCLSSDSPSSKRSSAVCVEAGLSGLLAGEVMGKSVPAKSRVAIMTEWPQTEGLGKDVEAFSCSFSHYCPGGQVAEIAETRADTCDSFRKTSALLGRISDLSGIYANTLNCLPICKAVEVRAQRPALKLITTGLTREMVPYFEKLTIFASIDQGPYQQGLRAVSALVEHLSNDAPLFSIHISPSIVFRSNLNVCQEASRLQENKSARLSFLSPQILPALHARGVANS